MSTEYAPLSFFESSCHHYTMTPRSGHNKTARAAVLDGSMFSQPCAPAQGRVPCTRTAAQAAALRLLYHDAAKRPQQNRIERGAFAQRAKCDRMGASRPARGCAFERGVFAQRAKCVRAAGLASPVGTANACRGKKSGPVCLKSESRFCRRPGGERLCHACPGAGNSSGGTLCTTGEQTRWMR